MTPPTQQALRLVYVLRIIARGKEWCGWYPRYEGDSPRLRAKRARWQQRMNRKVQQYESEQGR